MLASANLAGGVSRVDDYDGAHVTPRLALEDRARCFAIILLPKCLHIENFETTNKSNESLKHCQLRCLLDAAPELPDVQRPVAVLVQVVANLLHRVLRQGGAAEIEITSAS